MVAIYLSLTPRFPSALVMGVLLGFRDLDTGNYMPLDMEREEGGIQGHMQMYCCGSWWASMGTCICIAEEEEGAFSVIQMYC